MVKRVIVPFNLHSMSKPTLHILSLLIVLSIIPSSCYLNPQRESDTSEAELKGKVKYVKLNESYTEEYNKDGYLIKFIYPCNDYDEYKYDWHGYLKEMTSAHLLDYKITCSDIAEVSDVNRTRGGNTCGTDVFGLVGVSFNNFLCNFF